MEEVVLPTDEAGETNEVSVLVAREKLEVVWLLNYLSILILSLSLSYFILFFPFLMGTTAHMFFSSLVVMVINVIMKWEPILLG